MMRHSFVLRAVMTGLVIAVTVACAWGSPEYGMPLPPTDIPPTRVPPTLIQPTVDMSSAPTLEIPEDLHSIPDLPPVDGDPEPIAIVYPQGRPCDGGDCRETLTIYDNGAYRRIVEDEITEGLLSMTDMQVLREAISQTDFVRIRPAFVLASCPTMPEMTYVIRTEHGTEQLSNCDHLIDPSLELFTLLDEWFRATDQE